MRGVSAVYSASSRLTRWSMFSATSRWSSGEFCPCPGPCPSPAILFEIAAPVASPFTNSRRMSSWNENRLMLISRPCVVVRKTLLPEPPLREAHQGFGDYGKPSFLHLCERMLHGHDDIPVIFMAFDGLHPRRIDAAPAGSIARPVARGGRTLPDRRIEVVLDDRRLKLSNLDKVLWPQTGTTKGDPVDHVLR